MDRVRAYYQLTKPGVLYGNVLTAVAGYFLAAAGSFDGTTFFAMLIGQTAVIAAACVLNNYLDQDIDAKMKRTATRPSVTGAVSAQGMISFTAILLIIGFSLLMVYTPLLVSVIGIVGFVTYVWLYGALSKRRSIHGTLVGSISGAMPIAGGYAAASGVVDPGLLIAFLILYFWQFPEFFSIAIYRRKEYAAAGVPVMPVVVGVRNTIIQIILYTVLYVASTLMLSLLGYTGIVYMLVMAVAGIYWIVVAFRGLSAPDDETWARRMFKISMYSILLLCIMLSAGPILP